MSIIKTSGRFILGMVHCLALPSTPNFNGDCNKIIDQAVQDAKTLKDAGVDGVIIENMGDTPFGEKLNVAQTTALSVIAGIISREIDLPVGIDAAFNDYEASISLAKIIGGMFVRIPVFVDTVEFYGGLMKPVARDCMYYRKSLQAENIQILADIQVKYTNMLIKNIPIEQSAITAQSCGADAIIVTGTHTGSETPIELIRRAKNVVNIPVIVGSGATHINIADQLSIADGAIIGSGLKEGGIITNPVNFEMARQVVKAAKGEA